MADSGPFLPCLASLQHVNLGSKGAVALSHGLSACVYLKSLLCVLVQSSRVETPVFCPLLMILMKITLLLSLLSLADNNIGDEGFIALAGALRWSTSLKTLK